MDRSFIGRTGLSRTKRVAAILTLVLFCVVLPAAHPNSTGRSKVLNIPVTAQLSAKILGQKVIVHLSITNSSNDAPLYVEKTKVLASPPLRSKLFRIQCEGKEVAYIGPMAKKRPPTRDDFFRIQPGGDVKGTVDITELYSFLPGTHEYTIEYRAFHGDPDDEAKLIEIESNQASFLFKK